MTSMDKLRDFLTELPSGPIGLESIHEVERLLAVA